MQSWFVKQMDAFLTRNGRRLVGWDEILQGGLAEGATVMSWRGTQGGITAAQARITSLRLLAPSRTALRIARSLIPLHWQMIIGFFPSSQGAGFWQRPHPIHRSYHYENEVQYRLS